MEVLGPRRSWVEQIMGLPVSVLARGEASGCLEAERAVQQVFEELREVDARFSLYREESELSRLRREELSLADSHADVREVAVRCAAARERTDGLFDSVTPEGVWDPSGLVKGWATERAGRYLLDDVDWCLNAGGDVLVRSDSGEPFIVGIADPTEPMSVLATLSLWAGAVATSGTGARGAHLYDPRSGRASGSPWLSVSISGPSLENCDVVATAAFVAGADWQQLLPAGYVGLAVDGDKQLHPSVGWGA